MNNEEKRISKLVLNKETLRHLTTQETADVKGGPQAFTFPPVCEGTNLIHC